MIVSGRFPRPNKRLVSQFAAVTVADVGEAMDGRNMISLRPVIPGTRIVGPATTCFTPPNQNLSLHVALEVAQPGDIIVASASGTSTALWGMTVTVSAKARLIGGAVIDGSVRDINDIRKAGFPVWCREISPWGARKDVFGNVNVPIACADVIIKPGDLVVGDDDGIAIVPYSEIETVLARAIDRHRKEQEFLPSLREGTTPLRLLGLADLLEQRGIELEE